MSTPTIPTTEPIEFFAGDRLRWTRELSDWSADDSFVLSYYLILQAATSAKITITSTGSGTTHTVDEAKATTAAYSPGIYSWQAVVDDGTTRCVIDKGSVRVWPDFAAAAASDQRSHAKKVLDAIESVLEQRATQDQMSYSIAGRQLSRTPIPDLIVLRDKYKSEVALEIRKERIANGLGHGGKVLTRF